MTDEGRQLLISCEGLRLQPYRDAGGKWTIGIGHLITPQEQTAGCFAKGITEAEAVALLESDLAPVVAAVQRLVTVKLTNYQRDALTLFAFNVGVHAFARSTLLRKLNG